jgi:DNA-binding transcriptional LysR family regulator
METKIFEYLLAVEQYHSITKAADACFISQPALSMNIRTVEKKYNIHIFQHTSEGMVPTREGEVFLNKARQLLAVEKEMNRQLSATDGTPHQPLKIFTDTHFRNTFADVIWSRFKELYPNAELRLVSGDTQTGIESLMSQTMQFGVFPIATKLPSALLCEPLTYDEMLLVLPPDQKPDLSPEALSRQVFLMSEDFTLYGLMQNNLLTRYDIHPWKIERMRRVNPIYDRVSQGNGISILPRSLVIARGRTVQAFSFDPKEEFSIVFAWHKSLRIMPYHLVLKNLCSTYYGKY